MNKDFWLERWDRQEIGFHQADVNRYLLQYWNQATKLHVNTKVFVPLCGKSLDMLWLKNQGYSVTGIELSEKAINDFFSENIVNFSQCYIVSIFHRLKLF